ncbi:single-stranded DNA-binding protein [Paenibacillus apiarius]|uniref:single-stranded DNA-binding protein n=1 Tax=Paenibacillus apiarius TaxID=46240 RepID=UPI003B3AFA7A
MLNRVVLIGRTTRDAELRYTNSGVATATFSIAVDRPFQGKDGKKETDFIPVVLWRQTAEFAANNVKKGKLQAVEGRIQTRSYEKDGQKVYVTEVVADNIRVLEWGDSQAADPFTDEGRPLDISDDDMPF